jgi:amino acid adenylation domain-containing protein
MFVNVHGGNDSVAALELPFDAYPTRGHGRPLKSHALSAPHPVHDATLVTAREAELPAAPAAAFAVLLARYTGQASICLQFSRLRSTPHRAGTVTRAHSVDLGRAATVAESIAQTRGIFATLESATEPEPIAGDGAAQGDNLTGGRAAVVWLDSGAASADLAEAVAGGSRRLSGAVGVDADLSLLVEATGATLTLVYDANAFTQRTIERLALHLEGLIPRFVAGSHALVWELPLLRAPELRWLESVCDGPARPVAGDLAHALFEQQVARNPEAVAVRFLEQRLSYGELNRRANRLARFLTRKGIVEGRPVVVCVEPGFEIVIALLGILKAGAAYVPLDPSYPAARMRAILDDTRPELVVTQRHLQSVLTFGESPVSSLEDIDTELARLAVVDAEQNPNAPISLEQTAYVYYTSGTTGTPKGVAGSQRNLLHYVKSAERRYGLSPSDTMPAIARFSFSISMFELLSPLVVGGTSLILERAHILEPARMARTLGEVTVFHAGPSLLRGLIAYIRRNYPDFTAFSRVRHASSGGDMVPPELLEALKEIFTNAEVFVIYGCSEIACMGTTYPVPRAERTLKTYVGRPFENVSVRVLDQANNVLPPGVIGEIHFAGDGITLGYLNRPELTAEKFVTLDGRRFYRTGDRGRLSDDGWLEILGRSDFQTKIRGMRVELGEIEHALRRAPGVRDAVAVARDSPDQEKMLVAYVVLEPETGGNSGADPATRLSALRRYLVDQLPEYMVPARYVELDALPLNHNLKVDRRALPKPSDADPRAGSKPSVRAPETATARTLAAIWQKLLRLERVGLDDNFFELGGHSLLAMQFSLEVEEALGVRLEGMDILREPLSVLAAICDERLGIKGPIAPSETVGQSAADLVDIFHFGSENSLYGVFRGGARGRPAEAVLICGPVGQEQVRARFVLSRLSKQLASAGVPSLLFDYYGCGDSLGDGRNADPNRWQADIREAYAELRRRSNATRIIAVCVRLGALLLSQVAAELELAKVVLWDPVCDGAGYGAELGELQHAYVRSLAHLGFWGRRRASAGKNELLGIHYSDAGVRKLKELSISPLLGERATELGWLSTRTRAPDTAALGDFDSNDRCRRLTLDFDCGWRDLGCLEDVIPDVAIASTLARMVSERP